MNRQQHRYNRGDRRLSNTPVPVRGFTLVELMIVAVLLVILGGAFITTFLSGQTSYLTADAYIQVQQEARRGFDYMVHELRQSGISSGMSCGSAATAPVGTACSAAVQTQLNFRIARSFTAGNIDWGSDTTNDEYIHYAIVPITIGSLTDTKLVRWQDGSTGGAFTAPCNDGNKHCHILANYLTPGASGFLVSTANGPVVTLQLQFIYASPLRPTQNMGTAAQPLIAQVELRNP